MEELAAHRLQGSETRCGGDSGKWCEQLVGEFDGRVVPEAEGGDVEHIGEQVGTVAVAQPGQAAEQRVAEVGDAEGKVRAEAAQIGGESGDAHGIGGLEGVDGNLEDGQAQFAQPAAVAFEECGGNAVEPVGRGHREGYPAIGQAARKRHRRVRDSCRRRGCGAP